MKKIIVSFFVFCTFFACKKTEEKRNNAINNAINSVTTIFKSDTEYIADHQKLNDRCTIQKFYYDYKDTCLHAEIYVEKKGLSKDSLKIPNFSWNEKPLMIAKDDGYYNDNFFMLNDSIGIYAMMSDPFARPSVVLFKISENGKFQFLKNDINTPSGLSCIVIEEKTHKIYSFNRVQDKDGYYDIEVFQWKLEGVKIVGGDECFFYKNAYLKKYKLAYDDEGSEYTMWKWYEGTRKKAYGKVVLKAQKCN